MKQTTITDFMGKRKRLGLKSVFALLALIPVLALALTGCDAPPSPPSQPAPLFQDKFEYPIASPWTPANSWRPCYWRPWNIAAGGVSGNALEFPITSGADGMINSYTGTDYKVTVRAKVLAAVQGCCVEAVGRFQDLDNYYGAAITQNASQIDISIRKYKGGGTSTLATTIFKSGLFDSAIFYTLTLQVQGSTITATCSDGILSKTVAASDSDFAAGKVGVFMFTNPGYHVLFDDFTVTAD